MRCSGRPRAGLDRPRPARAGAGASAAQAPQARPGPPGRTQARPPVASWPRLRRAAAAAGWGPVGSLRCVNVPCGARRGPADLPASAPSVRMPPHAAASARAARPRQRQQREQCGRRGRRMQRAAGESIVGGAGGARSAGGEGGLQCVNVPCGARGREPDRAAHRH